MDAKLGEYEMNLRDIGSRRLERHNSSSNLGADRMLHPEFALGNFPICKNYNLQIVE